MRVFLFTIALVFYSLFIPGFHSTYAYGQKVKYVDPQKESKEVQKRILKDKKIKERRRKQMMRKKGLGERKKDRRTKRAERKNKDKSENYLDQVLSNRKNVSPGEKQNAYRRDRLNSKARNRARVRMKKNKVKKRKPGKH